MCERPLTVKHYGISLASFSLCKFKDASFFIENDTVLLRTVFRLLLVKTDKYPKTAPNGPTVFINNNKRQYFVLYNKSFR